MARVHSYHIYISTRLAIHRNSEPTTQMLSDLRKTIEQARKLTCKSVKLKYDRGLLASAYYGDILDTVTFYRTEDDQIFLWHSDPSYKVLTFDDVDEFCSEFMANEVSEQRKRVAKKLEE